MAIIDPTGKKHIPLKMVFLGAIESTCPMDITHYPHVEVFLKRENATLELVRYEAVRALKDGKLLLPPADEPNFITNAMRAAYYHTSSYRGTRSVLRGWPMSMELKMVYAFVPPATYV